jgi:hypothetical protein
MESAHQCNLCKKVFKQSMLPDKSLYPSILFIIERDMSRNAIINLKVESHPWCAMARDVP